MEDFIFYIHLASLFVAVVGIFLADRESLRWVRGVQQTVSKRAVYAAHWVVSIGLSGLVLSGLYMFWPLRNYLLTQPLFLFKMLFVVILLINSFVIDHFLPVAATRSYASLSSNEKMSLITSGVVSSVSWIGAVTLALILFGVDLPWVSF